MGPKRGFAKSTHPSGPLRGQLPIVWFSAPEGEWGCGIWKGGCPAVCVFWAAAMRGPPYVFLGGPLPKEEGCTACAPSLAAARLACMSLCLSGYIGE